MPALCILALESSCDETAAAVINSDRQILSSIVSSQIDVHAKYGGVVPELASREHLRAIVPVVREAIAKSGCDWESIRAVAATVGPGLVGSLLVGLTYAKSICIVRNVPLVGVNHLEGHLQAVFVESERAGTPVRFPALALVASGGHTHLYAMLRPGEYRLMGKTRDDAAGEAYDKVAKLLGFGYPGGPVLDGLAPRGDPRGLRLTMAKMKGNTLDFSFSGVKTAMLRWSQSHEMQGEIAARRALQRRVLRPSIDEWLEVTPQQTLDAIAAFQRLVIDEMLKRLQAAAEETGAQGVVIAGGVACNAGLRQAATEGRIGCPVRFAAPGLSTDNAAMIGAAAWPKFERGEFADLSLRAQANLTLA
jgi:N6-L-threonylcarbamoyladenine synthase